MSTVIHLDMQELDRVVHDGDLWTRDIYEEDDGRMCLHGAIRHCDLQPGDAAIIEQVGARFGFGTFDNDKAGSWQEIRGKVQPDITDTMLEMTFGPQWEQIVALCRRAATLTLAETNALYDAGDADEDAARVASSRVASRGAAWDAARLVVRDVAAWGAGWGAVSDAAVGLVVRDLIGQHGFTQHHYDVLTGPWATVIGPAHPNDQVKGGA